MKKKALIIVGHGSRLRGFQAAMEKVARNFRADKSFGLVLCAYLEITPPSIPDAIDLCLKKGAREIFVLPYFLLTGRHVTEDIPKIVSAARKKHGRKVRIKLCSYLGYHEKIVEVARERIHQ